MSLQLLRVSNAVAIVMPLIVGVAYGRAVGPAPWVIGTTKVALAGVLVAFGIVLGG